MPHIIREVQAPYIVNLDDEAVGRETIILQRDGVPVAVVVPYDKYQQLLVFYSIHTGGIKKVTSTLAPEEKAEDPEFERNRRAFEQLLPELLKEHRGEWVGIVNEKAVVFGETSNAVVDDVYKRLGHVRMYVDEVLETPRTYYMDSPQVVAGQAVSHMEWIEDDGEAP
jgi:hypothetical protein